MNIGSSMWKEGNYFAIDAYFKEGLKRKILTRLKKRICRIRRWYENSNIILFGDFNPDKIMTISKIENELNLKCNKQNKEIITIRQWRLGKESNSSLDYNIKLILKMNVFWVKMKYTKADIKFVPNCYIHSIFSSCFIGLSTFFAQEFIPLIYLNKDQILDCICTNSHQNSTLMIPNIHFNQNLLAV